MKSKCSPRAPSLPAPEWQHLEMLSPHLHMRPFSIDEPLGPEL
ncbi:hypothetical protein LINPERHAP2_LOCUS12996 [Linum perenne]